MAVEVGQQIGDYEILNLLGTGGMGRVYRVRNVISDRVEAMKILQPNLVSDPELAARFTAEIRCLASFDHPNIAQLRTAFQHENQLVMVMEFVEGATLEMRGSKTALAVDEVLGYASQVLAALSYAHSRGVVHRDLKPANMMVTGHGVIKLMDFGIAKSSTELHLTRPGTTMGSVYYMSPEQVSGGTVDARSDIYSLGVTLYELLTGRRPFQADTAYSVLNAQLNLPPQPPMELNPSLPAGLNNIILTALAKDPATRFQTADAFRNALRSLSSTAPAAASFSAAEAASPAIAAAASTGSLGPTVQPPPLPQFSPVDPAPPAETPYTPVAAAVSPRPVAAGGHRGLWIGLGAIAALAAMIAAVTILPHFLSTHATSAGNAVSHTPPTQASLPDSMTQPPPLPPQAPAAESGVQLPGTGTPQPPVSSTKPVPGTSTVRSPKPSGSIPLSKPPVIAPTAPNAQPTAPSATELGEVEDRLTQVSARAGAARDAIDQIRRQQEADGLGLRTDIASSLSRMNSYLQAANRSFAEHDAASADKSLDRAEKELETLETFLGK